MDESTRSSRRTILLGLTLGGAGFAVPAWAQTLTRLGTASPLSAVLPRIQTTVRQAALEGWAGSVGATFIVQGEAGPRSMTLISATALDSSGTRPADLRPVGFALVFEGAQASQVPAGDRSYIFQKSDGTKLQLFVGAKIVAGTKGQLVAILN
jgi:hypothetical protein